MIVKLNTGKEFVITSGYGSIDSAHSTAHTGIDLAMPIGTDIVSPVKGVVSRVVDYGNQNIGKGVMVVKFENGKELIFGHLSRISVQKGDIVQIGSKLGEAGSTGRSTGPHLHLGLKVDGTFADPSLYERLFQKVYASGPLIDSIPQKVNVAEAMPKITYLTSENMALLDQVQQAVHQLLQ